MVRLFRHMPFRNVIGINQLQLHLTCMRSRYSLIASIALLLVGMGFLFLATQARAEMAPPWSLQDLNGKTVKLSDFKGKVLVMNFWATWCPPCRAEIPDFIEIAKEYHGKGVAIIGISMDSVQPSEVATFVKKAGINYPIVMGTDDVANKYGAVEAIPVTVIIAPDGTIVAQQVGMVDKDYLEGYIKKLLPSAH